MFLKRIILLFLIFPQLVRADDYVIDHESIQRPGFFDMLTNLPEDWWQFKNRLVDEKNFWTIATILGSTGILVAADDHLWKESARWFEQSQTSKDIHWQGVNMGDGYFQVAMGLGFAALGGVSGNNRILVTSSQIFEVILSTGAIVQLMKHFTGRESPFNQTMPSGNWEPFPEQTKYYKDVQHYDAVPSGHLATAFGTFLVIQKNYPEQKWISWIGYPAMALIAEGLAGSGLHWWSDFPIALGLGYAFSDIITSRNGWIKKKSEGSVADDWNDPNFFISSSRYGNPMMNLHWRW